MNLRGDGDVLSGNILYVILVVIFTIGVFMIIMQSKNNAGQWEEFYAKELALLLDRAKPGDQYTIDIQKASELAVKNGMGDPSYIIKFDGQARKVVVSLKPNGGTTFSYFSNLVVTDVKIDGLGTSGNKLSFKVVAPEVVEGKT